MRIKNSAVQHIIVTNVSISMAEERAAQLWT
jgi:hypothetical protein